MASSPLNTRPTLHFMAEKILFITSNRLGDAVLSTAVMANLLDRYPDLDLVVDHMADAHPDQPDEIQELLDLARYPRVYVKISHTWSISQQGYPWMDTHAMVKEVYQIYGADRIMWGTDWPVCLSNAEYGQTLSVVRDEMTFIAPEDMEWVLGKTVLRLWFK